MTVKVTNATGSVMYATAVTAADGSYTVYIPASAGEVKVVETNLINYTSTGANVGDTAGTYDCAVY